MLVSDTEVLLLDEPASASDLQHQLQALTLIKEAMQVRKLVTIVALNDLNLVARYVDQVIVADIMS